MPGLNCRLPDRWWKLSTTDFPHPSTREGFPMTVEDIEHRASVIARKYVIAAEVRKLLDDAVKELADSLPDEDVEEAILEIVGEA